jgi:hypothetical protein
MIAQSAVFGECGKIGVSKGNSFKQEAFLSHIVYQVTCLGEMLQKILIVLSFQNIQVPA